MTAKRREPAQRRGAQEAPASALAGTEPLLELCEARRAKFRAAGGVPAYSFALSPSLSLAGSFLGADFSLSLSVG